MRLLILFICLAKINISTAQLPDFVMATQNSLESVVHINSKEIEDQYYKYYDPVIYFMILFLFKFKKSFDLENVAKKYFALYLFFLMISFCKRLVIY